MMDNVTGEYVPGRECAAGYTSRIGHEGVGAFEALRFDMRGLSWPIYAPDDAWSSLVVWCRTEHLRSGVSTLIPSSRVGRALARWDRAVSAWRPPAPFPRLPWPEWQGVFYDDADSAERAAWAYEWSASEPLPTFSPPAGDAPASGGGASQREGDGRAVGAGVALRLHEVRQWIRMGLRRRERQIEDGARCRRVRDEILDMCLRLTHEIEALLLRSRDADIALARARHDEDPDSDA
ncbi:unnamed protein product [Laminaria digitata]